MHSIQSFLRYMLTFCSFCCLPRQSQHSDSLLTICLEALFVGPRRWVLPGRGCFQALLSGCTIFAHNFMLKFCSFQISSDGGQHEQTKVHTRRDAGSVFVWHVQQSTAFSLFSTRKASCASFPMGHVPTPSSGLHHLHKTQCVMQQGSVLFFICGILFSRGCIFLPE